jgi:hypothetical protein
MMPQLARRLAAKLLLACALMVRAWIGVGVAAAVFVGILFGCEDAMSPASPVFSPDPSPEAATAPVRTGHGTTDYDDASLVDGYVCPPALDAGFVDILTRVLQTSSCGTGDPLSCHSTAGAAASGNQLDFTLDAAAVYAELLGADGGGRIAENVGGFGTPVERVVPYEAGASLLFIKLTLSDGASPHYGAGMPLTDPGDICPEALSAVRAWINSGASPVYVAGSDGGSDAEPADAGGDGED